MAEQQRKKLQRKLEELDVLGALDNLIDLADPEGGGSKRSRLELARLRMVQTITIAIIIAVSIIIVLAGVMGALHEKLTAKPAVPPAPQEVVAPLAPQDTVAPPMTQEQTTPPVSQLPPPVAQKAAPVAVPPMQKWEYVTLAKSIAQLKPAHGGGVYILTEEGQHYNRITHVSARGESLAQHGFETSIDMLHGYLGFDSDGCSYFENHLKIDKYDMSGKLVCSFDYGLVQDCPLPDGDYLSLGGKRNAAPRTFDTHGPATVNCAVARFSASGKERWRYEEKQYLCNPLAGPDSSVYCFSCPWVWDASRREYGPQFERAVLCRLSPAGKLKWRFDLASSKLNCTALSIVRAKMAFTHHGDLLVTIPPRMDTPGDLLLIDSATGKQLRTQQAPSTSEIAAAPDGTIYGIENLFGTLYAMDEKLGVKWQRELSSRGSDPPLVFPDSSVCIVGTYTLCGFSSQGKLLYDIPLPGSGLGRSDNQARPLAGPGAMVYVPRGGKLLTFLHRDWGVAQQ
jgi:hypothetical protein